ncbi:hypothetical protein K1719_036731 [Acacia pycnantha]|nr:hypothetical protein K1719_036731 [Acacia pycnantha]
MNRQVGVVGTHIEQSRASMWERRKVDDDGDVTQPSPSPNVEQAQKNAWAYATKVCKHTLITTLSNNLLDVYHVYIEANKINEYHKLNEELQAEKINMPDEFVASVLIKSFQIRGMTTNVNRKAIQAAMGKEMAAKENLVEEKPYNKRKAGVKVLFEFDKIVMTQNNVLIGKDYCIKGLFVLSVVK